MSQFVRLVGAALVLVVTIRVLDWYLAPVLPFLITLFTLTIIARVALGRRSL